MSEPLPMISFVRAVQEFFTKEPHGKKVEVTEFKALTYDDRVEMREMLVGQGYNINPLVAPKPEEAN